VVGDSVLRDTTRPVAEFRDKTVLAFEQKDVTGLALDMRDEKIALEQADGRWKVTKPGRCRRTPARCAFPRRSPVRRVGVRGRCAQITGAVRTDKPVRLDVQTGREKDRATKTLLIGRADPPRRASTPCGRASRSVSADPTTWTAVPKNLAVLR
jgi:hypothetical protein